ncbi:hypothetical protein LX73_0732 [Fodinibius salinus]|uniref:Uncharacterized protein n=1 Tax=Fodinibius salinus TaxID=860790 RepID=A0A5D3YQS2_9BACT|nr:hypothetical protein [Fodinibius salinus]TYP95429.1 hypothetical protein LX73_0732 [Fodinibius salinus]
MEIKEIIEFLNQNNGFFLVLLTAVYVIATIITVRKMSRANDLTQKNIEVFTELEKDKNRPSLIFTIAPAKSIIFEAKIKNIGASTAHNISINTSTEVKIFSSDKNIKFIQEGIPSLPPGAELSTIVGSFDELKDNFEDSSVSGSVKYERLDGKVYKEEFNIDLSVYEGLQSIREKSIHDVAKELKKIRKQLRHVITGFKKPLIRTINEETYREEQKKQHQKAEEKLKQMVQNQESDQDQEE